MKKHLIPPRLDGWTGLLFLMKKCLHPPRLDGLIIYTSLLEMVIFNLEVVLPLQIEIT